MFLGRIVPEKGIESLIRAFKKTKTSKKLVIAGASSDTDSFYSRMKKLAADDERIIFVGFVKGKLLRELYTNAYLYVLPSKLEGMPMGLLEAISYGKCCLVSNIPENLDIIGNSGLVFQKDNIDDLAKKMNIAIRNPDKVKELEKKAYETAKTKYDWSAIVQKTQKVYEKIK